MGSPVSVLRVIGLPVLYLLAVVAGRATMPDGLNEPVLWPSAGVAALWLVTQRDSRARWPSTAALGVLTVIGLVITGAGWIPAAVHGVAAVTAAMIFAVAAGRWTPGLWADADGGRPLTRLGELWRILLAAALAAVAGSLVQVGGTFLDAAGGFTTADAVFRVIRDVGGVLIFGTAVQHLMSLFRGRPPLPSRAQLLEAVALFAVSAAAYYYTFDVTHLPTGFGLLLLTVWAAVRMPTGFTVTHSLIFGCGAALYTLHGHGPFAATTDVTTGLLLAQLYLMILALAGLALAISRDEREALIGRLSSSEQEAAEKAEMMTTIVNSMTEGLAILDQDGRLVLRNPAAGRVLGDANSMSAGVALGSNHGFFRPDGTPLTDAELPHRRALAGDDTPPMDVLVRSASAPEGRIVRFNVSRLALHAGGPQHVVVVFHDVTADRRHREELMSFAGVVAHDLLNPLTTIEGWAEVLEQELAGYRPAERVTRIQRAAARMRTFLNGLLAYTAARDGKMMPTTVNLALLMRDIVNSRLDQAESTDTPPPQFEIGHLDAVEADPVLIRQLVENLIDNAVTRIPPGVTAYVSVTCQPAPNDMLRIDIVDNGIGLPLAEQREIFTVFHGSEGSGRLELAICKRIVERHGGTIEAMNNPHGSGTRMTFTLPAGRSAYARTLESPWARQTSGR